MQRIDATEILDRDGVPPETAALAYRELTRIHNALGNTGAIVSLLRRDPLPVRRVLDIGCAHGGVSAAVRDRLGVEVVGVDVDPPPPGSAPIPIHRADAVTDRLPQADVAFSLFVGHHLSEPALAAMIRNAGRSCRRLILVDVVRHRLPLALFRMFIAPVASPVVAADGVVSFQRAYTPREMAAIARTALPRGSFRQTVAPLYVRQMLDIVY